jgi:archaellum component FlaC
MAEEILDKRFKSEVMRLLNTLIVKADSHDKRFDTLENRFDTLENRFGNFEEKFDVFSGQRTDIGLKVIDIEKRLTSVE